MEILILFIHTLTVSIHIKKNGTLLENCTKVAHINRKKYTYHITKPDILIENEMAPTCTSLNTYIYIYTCNKNQQIHFSRCGDLSWWLSTNFL